MRHLMQLLCAGIVLPMLSACSTVQAWEKSTLGQATMKPAGPVPALAKIDGHVYYSKEAVKGGTGVGGGGCGCN